MAFNRTSTQYFAGGTALPEPTNGVKIEHNNVAGSESGRTEDGVMHIDWVRRDVRKIGLSWKVLTEAEVSTIIGAMQGQEFTFTYPGGSFDAYCGESSYEHYMTDYFGTGENVYTNVSLNVIEL